MFSPDEYIKKINKREANILSKQKREGIKEWLTNPVKYAILMSREMK